MSQQPRSDNSHIVDRLYRSSFYDTSVFGENTFFTQRYSGFFVPPISSLYSFNLRSDDQSRLYLSQNASTVDLGSPIIDVPWDTRFKYVSIEHTSNGLFHSIYTFNPVGTSSLSKLHHQSTLKEGNITTLKWCPIKVEDRGTLASLPRSTA